MRPGSTALLDRRLSRLASGQHGVVTRAQLVDVGLGPSSIARRIDARRLVPVHAGVYLVGHLARAPLATEMAAVLACGRGAVVSHRSAGLIWRLVSPRRGHVGVDVTVPRAWSPRRAGVRVHRRTTLAPSDIVVLGRLPVTSPARTLLDLGSVLGLAALEGAAAEAERRHGVGLDSLADQLERNRGRVGAAALRAVVERGERPALTRSEAERRLLRLLRRAGIAAPEANVVVLGFEVDLLWRERRVAVELDGYAFHADRAAFERDRARDAELQAHGYRVVRVTWRQLVDHPEAVVSRIRRVIRLPSQRGGY